MRNLRRGVLVLACGFALAACSSGGGGSSVDVAKDPTAALKAAGKRTADASSVKMTMSVGTGASRIMNGNGAFDFDKKLGRFKLNTTLGLNFDLVLAGENVFMKNPQAGGKPWISLTGEGNSDPSNPVAGFVSQLRGQIDPRETLRNLDVLVKNVKLIGTGEVRGEKATHLRGRVDLSDASIAKTPESMHEQLQQAQQAFGKEGYDVDVWLDGDGRVRRFSYATGAAGLAGASTVTMDLYAYGEDPEITVPKDSEVEQGSFNPGTTTPAG
jgi:hypothetical protein